MQKIGAGAVELNGENSCTSVNLRYDREILLICLAAAASALYFVFLLIPILSILKDSGLANMFLALKKPEILSAIRISFFTSAAALLLTFFMGTPVVLFLMNKPPTLLKKVLEILVTMPTVLPPAVAGLGLLMAFGRKGFIGGFLQGFGIELVFTPIAVVLAQFFVSSGFYIQVLKSAADSVEAEIFEVSYILGAGKAETFVRIIIPLLKKPIIIGLILSWTRALGEFGATIMFAGNVIGETRTMPLQIYTLMQNDLLMAASVSSLLFIISFGMLLLTKLVLKS